MKKLLLLSMLAFAGTTLMAADAKEDVSAAIKKLSEKKNYSWASDIKNEGGTGNQGGGRGFGPQKGKLVDDLIHVSSTQIESIYKGDKAAMKIQGTWQNASDLPQGGFQITPEMRIAMRDNSIPTKQAEQLLAKVKELKKESDGSYSGELTDEGIKDRLTMRNFRGANSNAPEIKVENGKGKAKFWVKDGVLTKYETHLEGKTSGVRNGESWEREVNRTTTVEITDVGSTKVEIPEEAKEKLS